MSSQKVNIACAIDQNNHILTQVSEIGRITSKALIEIYHGKVEEGSIVVSDSLRSYHRLMKELKIDWKKIGSGKKEQEGYTLEKINHLYDCIQSFFGKFRGISLRYLSGYLGYFQLSYFHKYFYHKDVFQGIVRMMFAASTTLKIHKIDSQAPIYP